jgi:hypothetical protein
MHKQEAQIVEDAGKPEWLPLHQYGWSWNRYIIPEVKAAGGL